jgi:hypothetical protein
MVHRSRNAEVRRGWRSYGGGHLLSKRRALIEPTAKIGEQLGLLDSGERAAHAAAVQPELQVAADCQHWEELQVVHARQ